MTHASLEIRNPNLTQALKRTNSFMQSKSRVRVDKLNRDMSPNYRYLI